VIAHGSWGCGDSEATMAEYPGLLHTAIDTTDARALADVTHG
jgi:hypothetical protein